MVIQRHMLSMKNTTLCGRLLLQLSKASEKTCNILAYIQYSPSFLQGTGVFFSL